MIYLAIGATTLVLLLITRALNKAFSNKLSDDPDNHFRLRSTTLSNRVITFLGICLTVILMWPPIPFIYWYELKLRKASAIKEKTKFIAGPDTLLKKLSISQIEAMETINTMETGVPCIAFGHLNSAWEQFKLNIEDDDELWQFQSFQRFSEIHKEGWINSITGYAILRNNVVVKEFYSEFF